MELSPLLLICIIQALGYFLLYDTMIMRAQSFEYSHPHTDENNEFASVYYVSTFSRLFFSLIYLLIADVLRYRLIIIITSITLFIRYLLFFSRPSLFSMHVSIILQSLIGKWIKATLPYLYSTEDKSKYQKVTAYLEASRFLTIFFSNLWDEIYKNNTDLGAFVQKAPIYINAIMLCIVLFCSYILPPVNSKKFRDAEGIENLLEGDMAANADNGDAKPNILENLQACVKSQWSNFKAAYTNCNVLKWSIWFATIGYTCPLIHYYNMLSLMVNRTENPNYTSPTTFIISDLIGTPIIAFAVIFYSLKQTNWKTKGDQILCSVSFSLLVLTILQYFCLHQLFQVILIQIFQIIVEVSCVICLWEIAQIIPRNSYALVVGFNMFVTEALDAFLPYPDSYETLNDSKLIFIYAILLAALGSGFGLSAKSAFFKKYLTGRSEPRDVTLGAM